MSYFTPESGLLGGSLIGLAAAVLLLFNGDIMGASGITSSVLLHPRKTLADPTARWKVVFLASFVVTANFYLSYVQPNVLQDPRRDDDTLPTLSPFAYAVSGLLVGFGTKMGNGCTSGHGICGMARMSKRSFVAVATFMTAGILTAVLTSPMASPKITPYTQFLRETTSDAPPPANSASFATLVTTLGVCTLILSFTGNKPSALQSAAVTTKEPAADNKSKLVPAAVSGMLFSVGLAKSGMLLFSKVYGFLDVPAISRHTYDPTLVTVMGAGFCVSFVAYQFVQGFNVLPNKHTLVCPIGQDRFSVPTNKVIDRQLVFGAAMFGVGWGIGGICPGPALFLAATGVPLVVAQWWPGYMAGAFLAEKVKNSIAASK